MGPLSNVGSAKVAFGHLTIAVYVDQPLGPENPWRESKERERERVLQFVGAFLTVPGERGLPNKVS